MAVALESLKPVHVLALKREPLVQGEHITDDLARSLPTVGPGWAVKIDGQTVAVGGFHERHEGVAVAWALMGREWRRRAKEITEHVRLRLIEAPFHRLETTVDARFGPPAHAWVKRLGFRCEGLMRGFGTDKTDHWLYARVRGH